jgi:uncharacterized protein Yka (UPF0111/DUF47 family)
MAAKRQSWQATLRLYPRCVSVAENADTLRPTAEQYRERAKLVRMKAAAVRTALLRRDLLDIAEQYDRLADSIEEERFSG